MTIAVDWDLKQQNKQTKHVLVHSLYCHTVEITCTTMVHTKISNEVHAGVSVEGIVIGPRCDKTCVRSFQQSEIQSSLLSYRNLLDN